MTSRVVLVRGPRTVVGGGGGCCSGAVRPFDEGGTHSHTPVPDEVGDVYRALRAVLPPGVELHVVSPSNWLWLVPAVAADARRRGLRGAAVLKAVRAGMAVSSLLVDGEVLFTGQLPPPAEAAAAVQARLATA